MNARPRRAAADILHPTAVGDGIEARGAAGVPRQVRRRERDSGDMQASRRFGLVECAGLAYPGNFKRRE